MVKRTVDDIPTTTERRDDGTLVIKLQPGRMVFCDDCGKDYTDSKAKGGLLFQRKAICPLCQPKWETLAEKHGEQHYIRAQCPEGKAFADWVREDLR